jgi:hypothetical protein
MIPRPRRDPPLLPIILTIAAGGFAIGMMIGFRLFRAL